MCEREREMEKEREREIEREKERDAWMDVMRRVPSATLWQVFV